MTVINSAGSLLLCCGCRVCCCSRDSPFRHRRKSRPSSNGRGVPRKPTPSGHQVTGMRVAVVAMRAQSISAIGCGQTTPKHCWCGLWPHPPLPRARHHPLKLRDSPCRCCRDDATIPSPASLWPCLSRHSTGCCSGAHLFTPTKKSTATATPRSAWPASNSAEKRGNQEE